MWLPGSTRENCSMVSSSAGNSEMETVWRRQLGNSTSTVKSVFDQLLIINGKQMFLTKIGAELWCLGIHSWASAMKLDTEVSNAKRWVWHWCEMLHVWGPGDPGFCLLCAPQLMLPANLHIDASYHLH